MNAAYALYIAGKVDTPKDGLWLAQEIIDSSKAALKLKELVEFTNK